MRGSEATADWAFGPAVGGVILEAFPGPQGPGTIGGSLDWAGPLLAP